MGVFTNAFQACAFDHSATSPHWNGGWIHIVGRPPEQADYPGKSRFQRQNYDFLHYRRIIPPDSLAIVIRSP